MPNPVKLDILRELRESAGLNQVQAAKLCGLTSKQGRISLAAWEQGQSIPRATRRSRFIGYLWDHLGLRKKPEQFETVWEMLVEEWQWEEIGDSEWRRIFPGHQRGMFTNETNPAQPEIEQKLTKLEDWINNVGKPSLEAQPPPPTQPPTVATFVGREVEIESYAQQLHTAGICFIVGMAGVGKTALATKLTKRFGRPDRAFWHSFHQGEGLDGIVWKLAGFLAHIGSPEVWHMLKGMQNAGSPMPPNEIIFDALFQAVQRHNLLLCFDDFHFVAQDPQLSQFVQRLDRAVSHSDLSVLITSRQLPEFVEESIEPLLGLNDVDTYHLISNHGLTLPDDLLSQLYALTEGNPQFLLLAISSLQQSTNPRQFIDQLADSENIERYLLKHVDLQLTEDERNTMCAVALLLGYPGSRDAIEAILNGQNQRRSLRILCDRHLLFANSQREYSQHAIVQAFYYEQPVRTQRLAMHQLAANYFKAVSNEPLRAAVHFERAGKPAESLALISGDQHETFIFQGKAPMLRQLLERFHAHQLEPTLWATVCNALGRGLLVYGGVG